MKLTKAKIAGLTLKLGQAESFHFDDDIPGFGIRLRADSPSTWVYQFRLAGQQGRMTIGRVSAIPVDAARDIASKYYAKVLQAVDPREDKLQARAEAASSVKAMIGQFLERQRSRVEMGGLRPRTYEATEAYLLKHWQPLHNEPLAKVDRKMVSARLNSIAEGNGPVAADRAKAALSAFCAWAIRNGAIDTNPTIGTEKHHDAPSRDRVLSAAELRAVWNALPKSDFGSIVKLLMLTGQRRDEIAGLRWSEVDLDRGLISLPPQRTKNGLPHDIPLSGTARDIIAAKPQRHGREFVFGQGARGYQDWSGSKERLDVIAKIAPWRLHDLRRTCATGMGELGVQPHIIEACLNHISGHKRGVAGTYNRATYAAEKARAFDLWAEHVLAIVEGRATNVTVLRRA